MRYGTSPDAPRWPACPAAATSFSFGTSSDHFTTPSSPASPTSELSVLSPAPDRRRSQAASAQVDREVERQAAALLAAREQLRDRRLPRPAPTAGEVLQVRGVGQPR